MSMQSTGTEHDAPAEFLEVFNVNSSNPLGIRLTKDKNQVTFVEPNSPLTGKVFLGDRVVAANGTPIQDGEHLVKMLKRTAKQTIPVTIQHGTWSYCTHKCTTVERILMDKDNDKLTGRAINIYQLVVRISPTPDQEQFSIDLQVRYDSRERLMVSQVDSQSVTAVHLRPGDIIREVNGKSVASKIMLRAYILLAAKEGEIQLLIETDTGTSYRDTIEMAPDVLKIAQEEVEKLKKTAPTAAKSCLRKKQTFTRRVAINIKPTVDEIVSDYNLAKLKPCKGAKL